jgi:hypothetical protein
MRILIDTNLVIGREDNAVAKEQTLALFRTLNENRVQVVVHPITSSEIRADRDAARREVVLSKLATYAVLEGPPEPDDNFRERSGEGRSPNDARDTHLLLALQVNAVDFLISEDKGILDRAARLRLQDRALSVSSGVEYFTQLFGRVFPSAPHYLRRSPLHQLNLADPFFDSFRADYPGFDAWFRGVSAQGRVCIWVPDVEGRIGALMIYKEEAEAVGPLPARQRLKICSMKVAETMARQRLSELILSFAFKFCERNRIAECYLTIYPSHAALIDILALFGFREVGITQNGERILVKRLIPDRSAKLRQPGESFREFFPGYLDTPDVGKFVVPVQPGWHERLFPDYRPDPQQRTLEDWGGGDLLYRLSPAGNAIRKAYLSNAAIRKIRTGDLLLFYRSHDVRRITHLGIVERAEVCTDLQQIVDLVGNRTVLPIGELEELCKAEVLALLFWDTGRFPSPEAAGTPLGGTVPNPPQSIMELEHEKYLKVCRSR